MSQTLHGSVSPGDEAKIDWVRRVLALDVISLRQPPQQNGEDEGDDSVNGSDTEKYLTKDESNGSVDGSDAEKYLAKDEETEYTPFKGSGQDSVGTQFDSVSLDNNSLSNSSSSSSTWSSSSSSTDSVDSSGGGSGPRGPDTPLPEGVDLKGVSMGKEIKSGAFGTVSWLKDGNGQMPLVMKVPKNESTRKELEHEAEFYSKVGPHENIAGCLGMQTIGGQQGLVLEGIKGGDMRKVMEKLDKFSNSDPKTMKQSGMDRNLSHAERMGTMQYMLRETLKGLAFLEEQGVVHTDIRPDNIMCDSETGAVKIVDFGLAHDSGEERQVRKLPVGHGMVAPEELTDGMTVNSNADVFATGELMRQTMEGGEFRYNESVTGTMATGQAARRFGDKDDEGNDKQSLNPMPKPSTPPKGEDGGKAPPRERMSDLRSNVARVLKDPLLQKNETVKELGRDIQTASRNVDSLDETEIDKLEERLGVVERGLKTSGGYRAITSYTEFVNWAMHPDPTQRPSAKEALEHPFLQDSMLDDEQARDVLKKLLAPSPQQPQTIPLDSGSDSDSSVSISWNSDSTSSSTGSGPVDLFPGFITRQNEGYTEFQTAEGGWTRDKRQAVKRQENGDGSGQGSDSTSTSSSTSSTDSFDSLTDSVGRMDDPFADFVTRKNDGYTEFQTAEGGWTRDQRQAAKRQKDNGGPGQGSGGDGTGRQYDNLSEAMLNPEKYGTSDGSGGDDGSDQESGGDGGSDRDKYLTKDGDEPTGTDEKPPSDGSDALYVDSLGGQEQEKDGSQDAPQDGKSGGWAKTKPSEGVGRAGLTMGQRKRGGETAPQGTPQPEEDKEEEGWKETRQSEGTQRGGLTMGRRRSGGETAPQETPEPEKKGGWTDTRQSEGTQRSGPTMGRRGGNK